MPPGRFIDDGVVEGIEADPESVAALRGADVRALALRASGLSPLPQQALANLAERPDRIEGRPPPATESPRRRRATGHT